MSEGNVVWLNLIDCYCAATIFIRRRATGKGEVGQD
jgi:hypothetical protein